jgi:hypothetical protein
MVRAKVWQIFTFSAMVFGVGCGGLTKLEEADPGPGGTPGKAPTWVAPARGQRCNNMLLAQASPSDQVIVTKVVFQDECSGLGGQWVLTEGSKQFFVGGHGCDLWGTEPSGKYAVVRYQQTAANNCYSTDPCIKQPGRAPGEVCSDSRVTGLWVFDSEADAKLFRP